MKYFCEVWHIDPGHRQNVQKCKRLYNSNNNNNNNNNHHHHHHHGPSRPYMSPMKETSRVWMLLHSECTDGHNKSTNKKLKKNSCQYRSDSCRSFSVKKIVTYKKHLLQTFTTFLNAQSVVNKTTQHPSLFIFCLFVDI